MKADASRPPTLHRARVQRTRVLVISFDELRVVERLLHKARQHHPEIVSIISAADDRELSGIVEAGATVVFAENLAAGLTLSDQVLLFSGLSREQAASIVSEVRVELNPELQGRVGV